MPTTSNFGWNTPADTDLVKDGAAAIRTLGNNIDASLVDLKGGTTGQVLAKATNTDLDFTWVAQDDSNAIQNAIVDAKGDLITASAADTPARLASSGVNGDVLTVDTSTSTGLKWAAISAGGMTVLASGTLSGASLSLTGIVGTYRDLVLEILNPSSVSGGGGGIEYSINSVASYLAVYVQSTTTTVSNISGSLQIPMIIPSGTNTYQFHRFTCTNYASTTSRKTGSFVASSTTSDYFGDWSGASPTGAITSITVVTGGAGNWDAGTYVLYGVS